MKESDLHYIAGLIEGEGCFGLQKTHARCYPKVTVGMTDFDIIERLKEIVGSGSIHVKQPKSERHRPQMVWTTSGEAAADLMREILPLMGERRSARIREILNHWDNPFIQKRFDIDTTCEHGYTNRGRDCSRCIQEYRKEWRKRNRDSINQYKRIWRKKRKENGS